MLSRPYSPAKRRAKGARGEGNGVGGLRCPTVSNGFLNVVGVSVSSVVVDDDNDVVRLPLICLPVKPYPMLTREKEKKGNRRRPLPPLRSDVKYYKPFQRDTPRLYACIISNETHSLFHLQSTSIHLPLRSHVTFVRLDAGLTTRK